MAISNYKIEIYKEDNGKIPLVQWIESIKDLTIKARIKNRLRRIELSNMGDYKKIGEGIFELRLHFGSGYRVYYGKIGSIVILLLCGGDKGSQTKDIKKAKDYWKNFKKNNK